MKSKEYLGCLVEILVLVFLFVGVKWCNSNMEEQNHQKLIEKKRNDSIRKAFVKDSILHDPRYQDSLRHAKAIKEAWERKVSYYQDKEIIGFVIGNDSIFHYVLHPIHIIPDEYKEIRVNYLAGEVFNPKFITGEEVKLLGLKWCDECEEIMDVYFSYENGDLINVEDAKEYVDDY